MEKEVEKKLRECLERLGNDTDELYDEIFDFMDDELVNQHGWDEVQDAIFLMLSKDGYENNQYECLAAVLFSAILRGDTLKAMPAIFLTNYRLNSEANPYENNTAWSITCELMNLDYANSEYNVFKDSKMQEVLAEYGIVR